VFLAISLLSVGESRGLGALGPGCWPRLVAERLGPTCGHPGRHRPVPSCSGMIGQAPGPPGAGGVGFGASRGAVLIMLVGIEAAFTEESLFSRGPPACAAGGSDAGRGWSSAQRSSPCTTCDFRLGVSPGKAIFGGVFGLLRMRTGRLVAPAVGTGSAVMGVPLKDRNPASGTLQPLFSGTGAGERMTDFFDAPGDGLWHEEGPWRCFDARRG
jgi:hypothetical protein